MGNRLPIALSATALVIVVLGVSPLGGAAIRAGTHATGLSGKASQGPRGPRGPRGRRGIPGRRGQRGPTGARGTTGQKGATGSVGPAASQRWAVAAGNGTLVRGKGLIASNPVVRGTTGSYSVFFLNQSTAACAWAASIANSSTTPVAPSGYLTLNQGAASNQVDVHTYATGGAVTDQPFMLSIFC